MFGWLKKAAPPKSPFGELWIDRPEDLAAGRDAVPHNLQPHFDEFVEKGFTIFQGIVPDAVVDRILADKNRIFADPQAFVLKSQGAYADPLALQKLGRGERVIDLYAVSDAAR